MTSLDELIEAEAAAQAQVDAALKARKALSAEVKWHEKWQATIDALVVERMLKEGNDQIREWVNRLRDECATRVRKEHPLVIPQGRKTRAETTDDAVVEEAANA